MRRALLPFSSDAKEVFFISTVFVVSSIKINLLACGFAFIFIVELIFFFLSPLLELELESFPNVKPNPTPTAIQTSINITIPITSGLGPLAVVPDCPDCPDCPGVDINLKK